MTEEERVGWMDGDEDLHPHDERGAIQAFAEREFLAASIAVWREIDRLSIPGPYRGLDSSTELRKREKAAWERYRDIVLGESPQTATARTSAVAPKDDSLTASQSEGV